MAMNLATLVFTAVPVLIQYYALQYQEADYQNTLTEIQAEFSVPKIKTYDFIVAGAGSAGCIVAGRLSEHFNVLLLEAGGNPVPASDVPAFVLPVAYDRLTNYEFPGLPQTRGARATGGLQFFSFGKMMGGSGSHNDMVHNRGSPFDYDNWANMTGDSSWAYSSVIEYFKKYENFVGELVEPGTEDNYGYDGPIRVDTDMNPIVPTWFEAAAELGYRVGDPNGFQREGFNPMNKIIYRGQRQSAFKGFIKDVEATRANLTVLRYSDVQEILIDNSTKRAYGVEFLRHGIRMRAHANREVIVSGGAFRSPLLLQKSGVGPADVLTDADILPKVIRPGVGRNLNEHVAISIGPINLNASAEPILRPQRLNDGDEAELERYKETGEGALAALGEGPQAFFVSQRAKDDGQTEWPDLSITLDITPNEIRPSEQEHLRMYIVNARAKNRGWIALNGTAWKLGERDDTKLSLIDFQLLGDPSDVEVLLEGIKLGLRIMENTNAFQRLGATYPAIPHPECLNFFYRSDPYWRCVIDQMAGNWLHLTGTNAMGRADDPMAVVDSKLRVIGVPGLRVIDASVMPEVPNGNTNAPTMMVAEKGAAEILMEHLGRN